MIIYRVIYRMQVGAPTDYTARMRKSLKTFQDGVVVCVATNIFVQLKQRWSGDLVINAVVTFDC